MVQQTSCVRREAPHQPLGIDNGHIPGRNPFDTDVALNKVCRKAENKLQQHDMDHRDDTSLFDIVSIRPLRAEKYILCEGNGDHI